MRRSTTLLICLAVMVASCTPDEAIRRKETQPIPVAGLTPSAPPEPKEPPRNAVRRSDEITDSADQQVAPPSEPIIVKGSGSFVAPTIPDPKTMAAQGDVTLNFVDTDIKDVVKGTLGDVLQATYTIDPKATGTVTIKTNTPITRSEIVPLLEQVLQQSGIALIKQGDIYTVTPLSEVKQSPLLPGSAVAAGYGSQVVRLRHVAATEMAKILNEYAPAGSVKTVGSVPNLLILDGAGPERAKLMDIISLFDVDRFKGMSFGIFPVTAADPETISEELAKIFGSVTQGGNVKEYISFSPLNRLNAVLVISADPARIDQTRDWINRLDKTEAKDEKKLYVHYVQHGDAKQIAGVLREIFDTDSSQESQRASQGVAGTLLPGAEPIQKTSRPANAELTNNDTAGNTASTTMNDTYDAGFANDDSNASPTPATNENTPSSRGRFRIIADEANNALFILATPKDYKLIDAAVRHLDVTALQVLIEATIAEVTLNDQLKYGVEWFFHTGDSSFTFSDVATGAVAAAFPGFSYVFSSSDARVVINALDKVTDVKVISSPQLMVLDNKVAKLQVGDQVPVTTQTAVSVETVGAPIVNSVEYKDTGVILTVKPRVNSSGTVGMEIEQQVSDVVPTTTSNIDSPTIQQRKVKSSVTVEDGQTIALGGLIRDNQSRGKTGIPLLSDIPVLGNLFKTNDIRSDRTELLILITPRVVRNPAEAKEVTDELRQRLQAVTPLDQKIQ